MYVCSSLLFYLIIDNGILILPMYHSVFRNLSNVLQISSLRCCRSECSQLNVLLMMALLKGSVSHISRKCPIGLPIWNSLPFMITDVVSGSESVGNGSFMSKRNSRLCGGEETMYRVTRITQHDEHYSTTTIDTST
jgi:hypothetical protein